MMVDFNSSLLEHRDLLQLCVSDVIHLGIALHLARGGRLRHVLTGQLLVLVLEQHVVNWRKTDTRSQYVVDACSLAEQCVDERSASRDKRSLAQKAKD